MARRSVENRYEIGIAIEHDWQTVDEIVRFGSTLPLSESTTRRWLRRMVAYEIAETDGGRPARFRLTDYGRDQLNQEGSH